MMKLLLAAIFCFPLFLCAQFDPPAGQPGSLAIHVSSPVFIDWANSAVIDRGLQLAGVDSLGFAESGLDYYATGKAGENPVVSLGDAGRATLQFSHSIRNGNGADFAVFENSFDGQFLELAFVEVSSDGLNYFRFPATSLTDTSVQISGFSYLEAKNLNNLAGKYTMLYGTPFDLEELNGTAGLDLSSISHIRIVDVVGTIDSAFCSRDAAGRKVNDPFPTPFISAGFDLDAVGVIHNNDPAGMESSNILNRVSIYPQPAETSCTIFFPPQIGNQVVVIVYSLNGQVCHSDSGLLNSNAFFPLDISGLSPGVYLLVSSLGDTVYRNRLIVK
jgi:hypothetical protein